MVKTDMGKIFPRDYGIRIRKEKIDLFLSPTKFILGSTFLGKANTTRNRIKSYANAHNLNAKKLEAELKKKVLAREKSIDILNLKGRELFKSTSRLNEHKTGVNLYNEQYETWIESKGEFERRHGAHLLRPDQNEIGYAAIKCNCEDKHYNDLKNLQSMCVHLSALELALKEDEMKTYPSTKNNTGLVKSELRNLPGLAFKLFDPDSDEIIMKALIDYYLEKKSSYEVSRDILSNENFLTPEMIEALKDPFSDVAQYRPVRLKEQSKVEYDAKERRLHNSRNKLRSDIASSIKERGFTFDGYCVENVNGIEIVSFRYVQGSQVMSICSSEDKPPIVVQKFLGEKGIKKPAICERNKPYFGHIDDATKRAGIGQILIPGQEGLSKVNVPPILNKEYRELNTQLSK